MACKQGDSIEVNDFAPKSVTTQEQDELSLHVKHVVETWALVKKDMVGNGIVFYERLLSENPELQSLFSFASKQRDDQGLQRQAKLLMTMIDYAIRFLGNLDELVPKLKKLGKRHFLKYKVKAEHFEPVGAALLWTLKQGLGALFTRDVEAAWVAIYGILAEVMIQGGKEGLAESTGKE